MADRHLSTCEDALAEILRTVPQMGSESVPLTECRGRVLFESIASPINLPAFDNSAMDGYAVIAVDTAGAGTERPQKLELIGESSAGSPFEGTVGRKQAVRIMTGALVPPGADAVLELEKTRENDTSVSVLEEVQQGRHVRRTGEDMKTGELILRKGALLTPSHIGVLAALGFSNVGVARKPGVTLITTGSELVDVRETPKPGQVRNSSRFMVPAFVDEAGGSVVRAETVGDDRRLLRDIVRSAFESDAIITTGGVSVGKYDLVPPVLQELDVDIRVHGVNIKPGKPFAYGVAPNGTPVFCLPGNPVSTAITFLRLVTPALQAMMGRASEPRATITATLEHPIEKKDGRRHYARGVLRQDAGGLKVRTTGSQSSGVMTSLTKANCLIVLPEERKTYEPGTAVTIEPL